MILQRSLRKAVVARGIGLHGGLPVSMTILPAEPDSGIVFRRVDLSPVPEIPAKAVLVGETMLCSTLVQDGAKVATIEHLMSAFAGLAIDNAIVELSAPEVPIMDGSSAPFVFLMQSAGIQEQPAPRKFIRMTRPLQVQDGDKWVRVEPYDGFRLDFVIDFQHPLIRSSGQRASLEFSPGAYSREISRARTFGFMREFEFLRSRRLGLGASLENAVAVDEFRVLNPEGLRYQDEFVRHKILDAVGDLYLLGHQMLGSFTAYKSGHALNNQFARAVLAATDAWELVTFADNASAPLATRADPVLLPA
jgi:UDP-3-O-[3-hydroxymyristoyl] N-acetylglucosamine deacetylase